MRTARDTSILFASVLAAVFSASLHAQSVSSTSSASFHETIDISQPCPVPEPYTATFKTTTVQKLDNGVTITRETVSKTAIDSAGRNYQENQPMPDMTLMHINDPVNHTLTSWNSRSKDATVFHLPTPDTLPRRESAHVAPPSLPPLSPQMHPANPAPQPAPQPQIEDLGTRTILGVTTTGRRVTRTIPAGSEGNDLPFTVTTETWRASEPSIVLLEIRDDPRTGTTTREATDFQRGEPDPSLFQIPDGYTVKDTYPNQQN